MPRNDRTLRLFVALYPPEDTARVLRRDLRKLDIPAHRETPLDQIHLTLQFIGDTPLADLDRVKESVARSVSGIGPFAARPERLISLPKRGRVRLVAAELDQPPGLMEIQRRLAQRLAGKPRARPGDRYLPHMTLCRFTGGARASDIEHPLTGIPAFPVGEIRLMRSVLRPEGAQHAPVEHYELAD